MDALRTLARNTPPDALAGVLGPAGPGLARLLPELAPDAGPGRRRCRADIQKAQLLELVLGLLGRLSATRPVMFVIEDLHWADQSTLDLTAFLVRSLREARVLLLATYRSDELHRRHPLRPLLTGWERVRSVRPHRAAPVRPRRGRRPARGDPRRPPAPGVADLVFDRSGGNAYLVEELAGAVRGRRRPGRPAAVAAGRPAEPGRRAQRGRAAAAAHRLGGRADGARPAARRGGRHSTRRELFAALREAVENHLLLVDRQRLGYAFRHALTRDAVYEDMLPGERVRLHAAYGDGAGARPALADDEAALPAALAHHWYAALDLPRALPASIDAARHAMASYAPAEALQHLERALEIWPRVPDAEQRTGLDQAEVSRLAAEAAYQCGAVDRAMSLLAQALAELPADCDPVRRALLLERYALAQRDSGQVAEAIASLQAGAGPAARRPDHPGARGGARHAGQLADAQTPTWRQARHGGPARGGGRSRGRGPGRGGRRRDHPRLGQLLPRPCRGRAGPAAFGRGARA